MNFDPLREYLDTIPTFGAPGVDCIIQQGHRTLFRHWSGMSDREHRTPMTGNEVFYLYSATKPITCVAAMQLVERGVLSLDDPVSNYIPEYGCLYVKETDAQGNIHTHPATEPLRLIHLLTMTSGLDYDLYSTEICKVQQRTNGLAPTLSVARQLASQPLCFEPGSHWQYSLSHDVLGAVIEVASGKTFGSYLHENIFLPLQMHETSFSPSPSIQERMMAQYRCNRDNGEVSRIPLENEYRLGSAYESGGAGLISTVADYARFASALANGGLSSNGHRILHPDTIHQMQANRLSDRLMKDFDWSFMGGYGYGLGVRTMIAPHLCGSASPIGEFGWEGAAGCYVLIDPKNRVSMFYAQQMRESLGDIIFPQLRELLYACL